MAKTKTVSGKELPAGDFAYVGDPEDISTWHLPIDEAGRVKDAMARFDQTDGIPAAKKTAVARKIANKAKSMGMDPSNFEKEFAKGTEHADFGNGWVEIFRAGAYPKQGSWNGSATVDDLNRAAANYDPSFHEAPACIGHPKDDLPAYGWVDRMKVEGNTLLARFRDVDPAFEEAVKARRFPKRSAAFYLDSGNRIAGLRHVAFLGAQPPEVKGLANLKFADGGRAFAEVEFGEEESVDEKTMRQKFGEWLGELLGSQRGSSASATFSEDDVKRIVAEATQPLQSKITGLESDLKTQTAKFGERETAIAAGEVKQRSVEAINSLKAKNRWIPAFDKMGVTAVFEELASHSATIEFGEAGADGKKPQLTHLQLLVKFFEQMPEIVPSGRLFDPRTGASRRPGVVRFTEGKGVQADPNSIALNEEAEKRAKEKNISFGEALQQIVAEKPELTLPGSSQAGAA